MPLESDPPPRTLTTGGKIRLLVVLVVGLAASGAWVYIHYLMPKSALGGPCRWALNCGTDAKECMRESEDGRGACTRRCEPGTDCAEGIRCIKIELETRDERGVPLEGGYCFPDWFIEAKKQQRKRGTRP